mgnify:CR=1 FL=1
MPRIARNVFPGIPHHITQRGNRREDVFFEDEDRLLYLQWLEQYCQKFDVDVLVYCLMTNHVHLVLVPNSPEGLQNVLKPLHMRYAQYINKKMGWKGHLWQGRFFSSALDDAYTCSAIRYVERNPVSAGMLMQAENYLWSSAASHCGLRACSFLAKPPAALGAMSGSEWAEWLAVPELDETLIVLRKHVEKGLPCGDDGFIAGLESIADRTLRYRERGRPKKG